MRQGPGKPGLSARTASSRPSCAGPAGIPGDLFARSKAVVCTRYGPPEVARAPSSSPCSPTGGIQLQWHRYIDVGAKKVDGRQLLPFRWGARPNQCTAAGSVLWLQHIAAQFCWAALGSLSGGPPRAPGPGRRMPLTLNSRTWYIRRLESPQEGASDASSRAVHPGWICRCRPGPRAWCAHAGELGAGRIQFRTARGHAL